MISSAHIELVVEVRHIWLSKTNSTSNLQLNLTIMSKRSSGQLVQHPGLFYYPNRILNKMRLLSTLGKG